MKDSNLFEGYKVGNEKTAILNRDSQGKYISKNGHSEGDPVKRRRTVSTKGVNKSLQVVMHQGSDV